MAVHTAVQTIEYVSPHEDGVRDDSLTAARNLVANARAYAHRRSTAQSHPLACQATLQAVQAYWSSVTKSDTTWPLRKPPLAYPPLSSGNALSKLAEEVGSLAAANDSIFSSYVLGEFYTALLPRDHRARLGIYYTPPALTARLLMLATNGGVDWRRARVLDPACGGGAFLTPVGKAMAGAMEGAAAPDILAHIETHLRGLELDGFGAWLSQVLLEGALLDLCRQAGRRLKQLVSVCDSLVETPPTSGYDLVIGNPPYGRVSLSPDVRRRYSRSLHGHANLYTLFLDLAAHWTQPGGVVAFITPTGFLGGEYFKALRAVLANEMPPIAIDLVLSRKGVFSEVLQETLLAAYCRAGKPRRVPVNVLSLVDEFQVAITTTGSFSLPRKPTAPWLIPRTQRQAALIHRMNHMPYRLHDYGYSVSTGPLVWNRHKRQLHDRHAPGSFPVVWSECVTNQGAFVYRTEKKNHKAFLQPKATEGWLLTHQPCVLVQRTTAKEQRRRLLAAGLPAEFIREWEAVSVENHLNMVRPNSPEPCVPLNLLARILNCAVVDEAFRCMSGSVAVSATELAALPLPAPQAVVALSHLADKTSTSNQFEAAINQLYFGQQNNDAP